MTDSAVMMAVGPFRFSMSTAAYQSLERRTAYRWEAVERLGVMPAQQYVGPGEDTITLSGTIYPHFKGGLGQVDEMRAAAGKGEPHQLVDGNGKVWGRYCITEIGEAHGTFFSNGAPRKIDFTMSLTMYGG